MMNFQRYVAERVGFEPTDACTSPVFKTGSFNRSDISPYGVPVTGTLLIYYHRWLGFVNKKLNFLCDKNFCFFRKKACIF